MLDIRPSVRDAHMDELRIVGDVQIAKLALQPGDVLVVKVDRTIDSHLAERIYGSVKPHLPPEARVLVIDPAIELSVLTASDINKLAR
jgi:hypothetical protein